jgi:heat-inducible transcriptional repressor
VQAYIETGEPVASRTIARRLPERLSPASIRNIMADLYEQGYLAQPHTSAGRVPTEKAFQSYVTSLTTQRVVSTELSRILSELSEVDTVQGRVQRSSHILMQMSHGVGIAAAFPTSSQTLDRVDLLGLADKRVLMVVVTRDGMVHNRVVNVPDQFQQTELDSIRNYLNANFSGWLLQDIRVELQSILERESAAYDEILKRLNLLFEKGLLNIGSSPEVHMEGASNLVGLDLHLTRERMRELFRALEQKKKVLHLLDLFLEAPHGELGIKVGLADVHPSMSELALIGVTVTLPNGMSGKVAVLGPLRMNYERVMSAVLHVGQAFQSIRA